MLPSNSPPLQRDLFVQSAFSTKALSKRYEIQTSSEPVARLETVIHTTPETVKEYLSNFGSSGSSRTGITAVIEERKEGGEDIVAYSIHLDKVRKALARWLCSF